MEKYTSKLVSEAFLLAILTAGSYWIAFVHEAGYLKVFQLPLNIIQIRIENILIVFFLLISASLIIIFIINLLSILWPSHPIIQEKILRLAGLIILFPLWHLINYGYRHEDLLYYLFFIIFIGFLEFIYPIFVYFKKGGWKERFIADYESEAPTIQRGILYRLLNFMGRPISLLVVSILILSWLSFSKGQAEAYTDKNFYIVSNSNLAVIRIYSDGIYCVQYIPETKEVLPNLVILQKDKGKIELIMKSIGPLKIKKE